MVIRINSLGPDNPRPARLLGDVGGTNARVAWQAGDGEPLNDVVTLSCSEFSSLGDAITSYLTRIGRLSTGGPGQRSALAWCAIGIANPITGDHVQMTNHDWSFSINALQRELKFERLVVINDFTALALALPDLTAPDLQQLGGTAAAPGAPLALIGPGTGLGVSGLLPTNIPGQWVPLHGEGGHVTLAGNTEREIAVLALLRRDFGHASAERAVSGQGLVAVHAALCELDEQRLDDRLTPARISGLALAGTDAHCVETLDLFCAFLGNVAGNLALTLGARGGVYVGGGIVPRLGEAFARSRFRACFEDKGRFRPYLAQIPVFIINADVSPALLGAARAL